MFSVEDGDLFRFWSASHQGCGPFYEIFISRWDFSFDSPWNQPKGTASMDQALCSGIVVGMVIWLCFDFVEAGLEDSPAPHLESL